MTVPPPRSGYVLISPVRDEERLIGATIQSVVNQTILPREWIIVSDGSTDRTNEIVSSAAIKYPWIRLLALPPRSGRCFAAVVRNTELGIASLTCKEHEFIGLLDSDVTFQVDYFERLMGHMQEDAKLGVCGGAVIDIGLPRDKFPRNLQNIPGATQFFRRDCYDSLGGLMAIPEGGWDSLTCTVARMRGWKTQLFTDLVVDHHKPRNIAYGGILRRTAQMGERDYALGYHPLFELTKCIGRMLQPPIFIGSIAWLAGYSLAAIKSEPRIIPKEIIHFTQKEQLRRLFKSQA